MKILITGVAGFIGSQVSSRFLKEGFEVVGVDNLSGGKIGNVPKGIQFIKADLANKSDVDNLPADCKIILHLAGQSSGEISFDDPIIDLEKNTISTLNLIHYGIKNFCDRIVYASSMSIYGEVDDQACQEDQFPQPLSCYGVGKLASEGYLRVYGNKLPYVALRMFNVYGPGQDLSNLRQGMVSIFVAQALKSGNIEIKGSLSRFRDFIYIDDVVEAWFRTATNPSIRNKILNLGTGKRTTVKELVNQICSCFLGTQYNVKGSTPGDQSGIYADIQALKSELGMNTFTSLDEGLFKFSAWAKKEILKNSID